MRKFRPPAHAIGALCLAAGLALAPAPTARPAHQRTPDLNGIWEQDGGDVVRIVQTGAEIEGRLVILTPQSIESYGFRPGDKVLEGRLDGRRLSGRARVHFPLASRARCPKAWGRWQPAVLYLSRDGRTLRGKYELAALYEDGCRIEPAGWRPWRLRRKRLGVGRLWRPPAARR